MKKLFLLLCFTSFLFAGSEKMEVVTLPIPNSNHITIRLMFQAGSIDDPAGKLGLTNLTARVVGDGGTKEMDKSALDSYLYPMATRFGVIVDKEATTFTTTIHKDHLDKVYPLFRDLVQNPRFDQKDFDRLKKRMIKNVSQDIPDNNDEVLSKRVLDTILFEKHPYGSLIQGDVSDLETITLDQAKAHYAKLFTRNRLMIGIAGGYNDAFLKTLKSDMKKLPKGNMARKALPEVRMPNGVEVRIVKKPKAFGSAIFMGYPLNIDRSDDDFAALMIASSYLGEHRKSYGRLYQEMRSKRSLNYGDYSYVEWYQSGDRTQLPYSGYPRRQNFFSMWIRPVQIADQFKGIEGMEAPELGNAHYSIRKALFELRKLIDEGMTEEDFQLKRDFLKGYLRLYVQSPSSRLGFMMDGRTYGRKDYIEEMVAILDKVTLKDVKRVVKKHLQADNMYIAIITDQSEADKLAESIRTNGSAPIVYKPVVKAGLGKDILDEDNIVDQMKLNVTRVEVVDKDKLFK